MDIVSIYDSIGPAGVVLLGIACVSIYYALTTLLYMHWVWRDFERDFLAMENNGKCTRECFKDSDNPLICIVRDIVTTHGAHSDDIRAEVAYLFHRNFEKVAKNLTYLKLFASISPMLGLLGTIFGMVTVFQTIAANSAPDAALLAAGIWEALLTTIMGLAVAIPVLMIYYFLFLKFKGFHIEAIEHSYRALEIHTGIPRGARRAGGVNHV